MNIEEQRRAHYFTIANLVILLSGALLIVMGGLLSPAGFEWHSTLLGIGSSTIVVALLFFLGRILLIDPQQEMEERLKRIELRLDRESKAVFSTRTELNSREPMDEFIRQSSDLFLCGVTLATTVRNSQALLREKVREGTRLRFAILDPVSPDVTDIGDTWQISSDHIANDIRATLAELAILQDIARTEEAGSVEVRLLRSSPTFCFALRNVSKPDGVLRAELRGCGMEAASRPGWELRAPDSPWYERLVTACERLWDSSKPWYSGNVVSLSSDAPPKSL